VRCTTATKDSKSQNKDDDLNTTTDSCRDNQIVLCKQHGPVLSQVELGENTKDKVREERAVDTDGQPTEPCADDGGVDVVESKLGEELVSDPEGEGSEDADSETDGDHVVLAVGGTEDFVAGTAPCDGLGVVGLHVLAGPDVGSFDGEEDVALVVDDGVHHDPVEDGTDDGTEDLGREGGAGWEFGVLA